MKPQALPDNLHLDTLAVRIGLERSQHGENSEALFLTSGYVQSSAASSAARFAMEEDGFTYSRVNNPTVASMEMRLAALEGTEAAIATSTGMAAILLLGMAVLKAGDHVICSQSVFGSVIPLFGREFAKFGVSTTFVSQTDLSAWQAAVRPETKLLFAETPTNPLTEVCDIQALADIAHNAGAFLALDNCFATPALQRPAQMGVDFIVHSGTKFLDGQGRVMAGAICCTQQQRDELFLPVIRSAGMVLAPFNAWVLLKGMETLSLRMKAQSETTLALAQWLETLPQVARVFYPGLPSHPQHALAMRQQSGYGGAVLSFEIAPPPTSANGMSPSDIARSRAFHVLDSMQVISLCTNLGDTKTLAAHPATTSHGRLTEPQRLAAGISQGLVRVAVGLDYIEDIKTDLARGLQSIEV
jgi:O-succinylhomoserine sulfhydrylase